MQQSIKSKILYSTREGYFRAAFGFYMLKHASFHKNHQKVCIILWRLLTQTIESVLSSTTIILLYY